MATKTEEQQLTERATELARRFGLTLTIGGPGFFELECKTFKIFMRFDWGHGGKSRLWHDSSRPGPVIPLPRSFNVLEAVEAVVRVVAPGSIPDTTKPARPMRAPAQHIFVGHCPVCGLCFSDPAKERAHLSDGICGEKS